MRSELSNISTHIAKEPRSLQRRGSRFSKTRGKLIVIDGIDKVGKETQTNLLVKRLRKEGKKVRAVHFPRYGENLLGALIRECIEGKHGDFAKLSPKIASVLYAADRFETKVWIEKLLARGYMVIADRYVSSNQIHQGGKIKDAKQRKEFLKWLDTLEYKIFGLPRPHLVIYLELPLELSHKLKEEYYRKYGTSKDTLENDKVYYHNSARSAHDLGRAYKWRIISCADTGGPGGKKTLPKEVIHERVYTTVHGIL